MNISTGPVKRHHMDAIVSDSAYKPIFQPNKIVSFHIGRLPHHQLSTVYIYSIALAYSEICPNNIYSQECYYSLVIVV